MQPRSRRRTSRTSASPTPIARATASDPKDLSRAQASVAHVAVAPLPRRARSRSAGWCRKRGRVGALVNLDPTLILAVMAVESSFNPFAQSPVGAQGLMQVMTKVHDDKYEAFGGSHAAFDPVTNLRVGVQVLKECIARGGSLEAGLRSYVGAANTGEDGGYAAKVLAEQAILRLIAGGAKVRTASARQSRRRKPAAPVEAPAAQTIEVPASPAAERPRQQPRRTRSPC